MIDPGSEPHNGEPDGLHLCLYVAGNSPNSVRALANLRAICSAHFATHHDLEIVDMLLHPLRALADGIVVTPTLVKLGPPPLRRLIGDLSDTSQVLLVLAAR